MLLKLVREGVRGVSGSGVEGRRAALAWIARAASAAALGALVTCDNIDNFEVTVGGKGVAPKGTVIDELLASLAFNELTEIDLTREFENQGVTKGDVDSVRILEFTLTIESPASANFDFLTSVAFFAETDGEPKVLIAKLDQVPKGVRELVLAVEAGVELKPYVVAPKMRISSEVEGKRPPEDTTVAAEVVLDVDVNVPGC
jgi:hypothetical protein